MEARRTARRKAPPACLNMANTALFYPPWTVVKNRESTTTDFDDTDFEVSDTEEESPRVSMGSLGYDSNSSISTPDPPTPDDAPKHPYTFHDDKSVEGPSGPHLFRNSISSGSIASTEIDLYFERSPVQSQFTRSTAATPNTGTQFALSSTGSQFPQSSTASQFPPSSTGSQFPQSSTPPQFTQSDTETTSTRYAFSPCTPQAYATVHPDVSQVEEAEIRKWSPSQVAHWMHIAGYDGTVIDQFLINDITGSVLLSLQIDDLKELGIQSFGKRHQIMTSIDHLRNTMMKTKRPESRSPSRRSYAMSVSPTGEVISRGFKSDGSQVTPGESVSIVGIEQVLPKPHNCSKGENCPKFRRRQRQLEKLAAEFPNAVWLPGGTIITGNPGNPATAQNMLRPTSEAEPSVVASSDVLGPAQQTPRLCEEALNEVKKVDRQESVRQFLNYQHVESPSSDSELPTEPSSKPVISISPPAQNPMPVLSPPETRPNHMAANLRNLPKLTIPTDSDSDDPTTATAQRTITPSMVSQIYGSPTTVQQYGPFTSARYIGSDDYYRQGTPFSEMDVPVTAIPDGPVARETSQSVPPDMRYGNLMQARYQEPVMRSASTRPRAASTLRRVKEGRPLTPIEDPADLQGTPRIGFHNQGSSCSSLSSDPDVTRSGYMKKRKQTRFLRHEWQDAHFTLRGTNLAMHKDELAALRRSKALEEIDVDDYAVACSSLASSSKLTAALKKSILRNNHNVSKDDAAFAFSLIPSAKEDKKMIFSHNGAKSHHFAVKTRDERIDWMRELMLAKALRKGKEGGAEVQVNGNFI